MGKKWNKNYIRIGIVFTVSICVCIVFQAIIKEWKSIFHEIGRFLSALTPIFIGMVFAFLLNPIMLYFRKGIAYIVYKTHYTKRRIAELNLSAEDESEKYDKIYKNTKYPALVLTIIFFLGLLVGFFSLVIPSIYKSLQQLVEDIPRYANEVQEWVTKMFAKNDQLEGKLNTILESGEKNLMNFFQMKIMPNMDTIALKISSGVMLGVKVVINFFIGLIVMVYMLASKETLIAQCKKVIYCLFSKKRGNKIMNGLAYANTVFGGFINGKILDSLIIGIICFIFTNAMNMTYAVLISVLVGVTNVIPFFGPFIGAVPGALLALMDDPLMFVIFVIFVLCLQQFDGNILGPIILGDSTGLSGMWVLFAILVGGDLFGVPGMILGVPVFACIYAFIAVCLRDSLRAKNISPKTEDFFRLTGFDEETEEPIYRSKHEERITARQRKKKKIKLWKLEKAKMKAEEIEKNEESEESVYNAEAKEEAKEDANNEFK